MISNINYKGDTKVEKDFEFIMKKPRQCVKKCKDYSIIIFQSGKCRIMGCKKPLIESTLPFKITNIRLQSITVTANLNRTVNLYRLAERMKSMFEPELFPALRCLDFNPLCVNVFASGKVVILGIRTFDYKENVNNILLNISCHV